MAGPRWLWSLKRNLSLINSELPIKRGLTSTFTSYHTFTILLLYLNMNPSLEELKEFAEQLTARDAELTARYAKLTAELTARHAELTARDAELTARDAEFTARDAEFAAARQKWEEEAKISRCEARSRQEDEPELWHPSSQRESFVIESSKVGSHTYWIHSLTIKYNR